MTKWISVKDRLPKHGETVLAVNKKRGKCVLIFIDLSIMKRELECKGIMAPDNNGGYSFCSQEIQGNVLNDVTHWMPLPESPHE